MVKVLCDFAYNEELQSVLASLDRHGAKILGWTTQGPTGGNPNILLAFESRWMALQFLMERYPDDDDIEPNLKRIHEVAQKQLAAS